MLCAYSGMLSYESILWALSKCVKPAFVEPVLLAIREPRSIRH